MYYTLYNLQQDVNSNLHSGGVSQLQNFYNTVDKGRRALLGKVRPEELIRTGYLEPALYPHVDRYAVPEDLKYDDVIQIQLLNGYRNVDTMSNPLQLVYRRQFHQKRPGVRNVINIGYDNGIKYARIDNPQGGSHYLRGGEGNLGIEIQKCDSLTDNGTWNGGGNIVNIREDKLTRKEGSGSISFDINNSSATGFIENIGLTNFDLYEYLDKGAIFAWFDFGVPQNVLDVKITMGSDPNNFATDLYVGTVNQPHDNNQFTAGWNLLKYVIRDMQTVGTPNPKALCYLKFEITTAGNDMPNVRLDNVIARKGKVYEITYNSRYMFQDPVNGTWKKFASSNTDMIIAEEDTYNLLVMETTLAAQKEIYGNNAGAYADVGDVTGELKDMYNIFKREHKSEALLAEDDMRVFGNQYDGLTSNPMPGYGDWN